MPFIFTFRYDNTCHTISVLRSHSALMPYQNTKTRSETVMSLTNIFELISHKKMFGQNNLKLELAITDSCKGALCTSNRSFTSTVYVVSNLGDLVFLHQCTLRKIPKFHLIFQCGNFVEGDSFRRVSRDSPGSLQKLYITTEFPHQEIS